MKVYTPELTSNESTELIEKAKRKLYETIMKKRDKFILTYKRIPRYVIVSYDTMYALEAYFPINKYENGQRTFANMQIFESPRIIGIEGAEVY